ncbi:Uncharacterised protein [Cedecea neteri]|uniref:Uncharacterized protein n=1 Tax=Cedecea neteri TaxID=158822 RepID=A0A2X3JBX0_9ENTR|nr:Uncharacterised protein [Cedecea neteri]
MKFSVISQGQYEKETDVIKQNGAAERVLDAADRRILGALVEDATISYANSRKGRAFRPAVHERSNV